MHKNLWIIWGYGLEGQAVEKWLQKKHPEIHYHIIDESNSDCLPGFTELDVVNWKGVHTLVLSPGVSLYREEVQAAVVAGVRLSSSTQLWLDEERAQTCVIGISGSKGKSTTASLLHHLLIQSGRKSALAGNVGEPLLSVDASQYDYIVLELSSYQLATLDASIDVAIITNLYPEHLDWHRSERQYYKDKLRLLDMSEISIYHDSWKEKLSLVNKNIPLAFKSLWKLNKDEISDNESGKLRSENISLKGAHNMQNVLLALQACNALDVNVDNPAKLLEGFRPLPHRLEDLGVMSGLKWVDDSISTIPQSSFVAIEALGADNLTVILGGHDRGISWVDFAEKVKGFSSLTLITMPENGDKIYAVLSQYGFRGILIKCDSLLNAVKHAHKTSDKGGTVLLSPGAPSYGDFNDFKERGCFYLECIKSLNSL